MNFSEELMTSRGQVIGLGRVKIPRMPKLGFDCEIPLLSFIVIQREDETEHIATCIHLHIDGYGKTMDDAINDMVGNVWYFLHENFKSEECRDSAWDNLLELFKSNPQSDVLWDKYHALQVLLARDGRSADRYSKLYKEIQSLKAKVRELEARILANKSSISEIMPPVAVEKLKWVA